MRAHIAGGAPPGIEWVIEVHRRAGEEKRGVHGWESYQMDDHDECAGWDMAAIDAVEARLIDIQRLLPGELLCLDTALAWAKKMQEYREFPRIGTYRIRNTVTNEIILADIL